MQYNVYHSILQILERNETIYSIICIFVMFLLGIEEMLIRFVFIVHKCVYVD